MTNEAEQSELIAAYITGGLSADERLRVERRAAAEPAFAAQLEEFMALDLSLKQSAGVESVLAGLEDRLTAAVEAARPVTRFAVHPLVRKAAVATAACLLLGTAGYFASTAMDEGKLPLWESRRSYRTTIIASSGDLTADRQLQTGDLINVTVNDLVAPSVETTKSSRVASDGTINLPLIGKLKAEGLTQPELEKSVEEAYRKAQIIDKAQVSITTNESNGRVSGDIDGKEITGALKKRVDVDGDLDAAKMLETSAEIRKREAALGRDLHGYIPDFSDAPSFNLQSTSGAATGGSGGGGGGLFGKSNMALTDPYAPGSTIKPFKPSETLITSGKKLDVSPNDSIVTGNVTAGRQFRGKTDGSVSDRFLRESSVIKGNTKNHDTDGQNVTHADGHAEFQQTPLSGTQNDNIYSRGDARKSGKDADTDAALLLNPADGPKDTRVLVENTATTRPANGTAVVAESRKIIRSGEMVFEIDRFDSAAATIGKIVGENGGLIATTNSDKLPNGKVRGSIIVRIPPDKLDLFILQLRALGDLKSQRLGSADVTKEYYDLASELRAARAMEERLLEMIKSGQGAIKDLLEAEKELANWRGKIEKIIGQTKYYDNLVSLATLTITLQERDIAAAAASVETEAINSGIETDDVEKARTQALEILKDAKARVISSNLNKLDAGQVASTIVADIPPDNAGAVVDRIKQLGKVARLEVAKSMTADANAATTAAPKTERKDARLTLSLYNVANVQPRVTSSIELASADAAAAYRALADKALKAGGRVVKGGANQARGNASQADGVFEVPAESAEAFLAEIKAAGDVISLATTESPDTANVTTSKRGFTVVITPAANLPPRRSANLRIETGDVEAASANLQATLLAAGGRVLDASNATDPTGQSIARVVMDVPLAKAGDVLSAAKGLGTVRAITSGENAAAPAGALAKARLEVTFATPGPIVSEEGGLGANLRHGLSISARGLVFSAKMIVVGLCFVLPWLVVLWAGLKLFKRRRTAVTA